MKLPYKFVVDGFRVISWHPNKQSALKALNKFKLEHPNAVAWIKRTKI